MYQDEIKLSAGEGRYKIYIFALATADGVAITITGGERPHVGGTALAVPRKSLSGEHISCDTWTCPVPGHKDIEMAASVARMVCLETRQTTAVTAGVHIDEASRDEIATLVENGETAARMLVNRLKELL